MISFTRRKLGPSQLRALLQIARRCLVPAAAPAHAPLGIAAVLWRCGLLHCWYRQSAQHSPSLVGPYFSPTGDGWKIARRCGVKL